MISEIEFVTGKIGDRFCRLGVELIVRLVDDDPTRLRSLNVTQGILRAIMTGTQFKARHLAIASLISRRSG
jgi:hypothetical protein